MRERGKLYGIVAAVVALMLLGAACGSDNNNGAGGGNGGETLTGDIFVSGSSTVEPVSALVAELFAEQNPDVNIAVEGPGTSDGFELFCNGETDVQDASRAIKEEEVSACESAGVEYVELYIGIDGMAVLTSPENASVTCLGYADLWALIGPEAEGIENWQDAIPLAKELGSKYTDQYPDAPLDITAPGEESGTFDSFVELGLEPIGDDVLGLEDVTTRPDYVSSGNDNVIIEGIAGAPASLGWVGYAFYEQNQDVVKAIAIDGGSGCVAPSPETIADGSYPLSRPLFIYPSLGSAAENPALVAFVDYYMTPDGLDLAVSEVGYVPIPAGDQETTRAAWEDTKSNL
ncbi:MAG: substrate-binding domain-containing protein [Actinomycetota bacterium]